MSGVDRIAEERARQIADEGWSPGHDDRHIHDELARAAVCYTLPHWARAEVPMRLDVSNNVYVPCSRAEAEHFAPEVWPWSPELWRPSPQQRIRELAKAGALIAAEIDRLERRAGVTAT